MLATWILCVFIMLVIPAVTVQTGWLRLKSCSEFDAERGYHSALALSSPEAWAYAQKASSMSYLVTGIAMAVLSLLAAFGLPKDSPLTLFIFTGTVMLFQSAAVIVLIACVESGLRNRFGKKAAK